MAFEESGRAEFEPKKGGREIIYLFFFCPSLQASSRSLSYPRALHSMRVLDGDTDYPTLQGFFSRKKFPLLLAERTRDRLGYLDPETIQCITLWD